MSGNRKQEHTHIHTNKETNKRVRKEKKNYITKIGCYNPKAIEETTDSRCPGIYFYYCCASLDTLTLIYLREASELELEFHHLVTCIVTGVLTLKPWGLEGWGAQVVMGNTLFLGWPVGGGWRRFWLFAWGGIQDPGVGGQIAID